MNSAEHVAASTTQETAPAASLGKVTHELSDYLQAWSTLLASETRLARDSLLRLGLAALVLPALALGSFMTIDAFLVAILSRLLQDWSTSLAIVLFVNLAGGYGLLMAMRRWWRNLTLPRSRAALVHLLERLG